MSLFHAGRQRRGVANPGCGIGWLHENSRHSTKGSDIDELLCVIAILAILLALYLPAIIRAFIRVKKFLHDL